ncbi:MAG: prepilin-type N-terminal cleavage/methylation domain-containing protein [Deltaproteobacteria bacterium]|nr:prepilin-type N-terminal cleavage/methylation domain-containing protein [Deltaproteobacteria bacterium]
MKIKDNRGFTLIEIIIAIFILVVALMGLAGVASTVISGNSFSKQITTATTLAQEKIEELSNTNYQSLADGTDTQNSIYTRTWTITLTAPHVKTIVVEVQWNHYGNSHDVTLKTMVTE